jgi:hypothetical protein
MIPPNPNVPTPDDPNLYLFTVIGEVIGTDLVRAWITDATLRELKRYLKNTDTATLSNLIVADLKDTGAMHASAAANIGVIASAIINIKV